MCVTVVAGSFPRQADHVTESVRRIVRQQDDDDDDSDELSTWHDINKMSIHWRVRRSQRHKTNPSTTILVHVCLHKHITLANFSHSFEPIRLVENWRVLSTDLLYEM